MSGRVIVYVCFYGENYCDFLCACKISKYSECFTEYCETNLILMTEEKMSMP